MSKITPIQTSFSAGEISPLMYQRSDTEGYQAGVESMVNMFPDSRGPAVSRAGSKHEGQTAGDDGRIFSIPVNNEFFYTGVFTGLSLKISSLSGDNPSVGYTTNASFNTSGVDWTATDDGHATSNVLFVGGVARLTVGNNTNRFAQVEQETTGLTALTDYKIKTTVGGNVPYTVQVGTTQGAFDLIDVTTSALEGNIAFTTPAGVTSVWIVFRIDSDHITDYTTNLDYFGVLDAVSSPVIFTTPYLESDVESLQYVVSPAGNAVYVLHGSHPPQKLGYTRTSDSFSWDPVTFVAPPVEWSTDNYPICGDFFEGRLWLGGSPNHPQTFWSSKSGVPEDFTQGKLADDGLTFTMAKYGAIKWMVGFKNLVIGTSNAEHIVTSDGGYIAPDDIQVEQQSSYGSVDIQPVQVGDQIFYVSADRRKLRAIQYEWQKDNWLSKDLTFNSEHITASGIKHIAWQQNPVNRFHCALTNGSVATLTYERGHNVYGWSIHKFAGAVVDITVGSLKGSDYLQGIIKYNSNTMYIETQSHSDHPHHMDSWIDIPPEADGVTIKGLSHLEGQTVQVLVDDAVHPDRVVVSGEIAIQPQQVAATNVTVGLQYTTRLVFLPFDQGAPAGSGAPWTKRWNKIYARVQESTNPLINGERSPERHPSTLMNTPEKEASKDILMINSGFDRKAQITIEQDLPLPLTVLGVFGELAQSIT